MRWWTSLLVVLALVGFGVVGHVPRAPAAAAAAQEPAYTADGKIVFPRDYRNWVYLATGLGMSYSPRQQALGSPAFDNVFVTPAAYRAFLETGHWPDKTMFVIEVRASRQKGSINKDGHFQGDVLGYDFELRDDARFPEKWKWTAFDAADAKGSIAPAQAFPKTASCFKCHSTNTAVDLSFVQFYPTLLPIARAKGTLNAAYLAAEKAEQAGKPPAGH